MKDNENQPTPDPVIDFLDGLCYSKGLINFFGEGPYGKIRAMLLSRFLKRLYLNPDYNGEE